MRNFGLIGYPLGHSFSQKYFSEKFDREHLSDCRYDNYPVSSLGQFRKLIEDNPDLLGLNVTIPYKSEILKYVDFIDAEANEIGAVNVLKIKRNAKIIKIHGFNSDVTGIRETLTPWLSENIRNAIILGTGGSSLAVRHVLKNLDINVIQVSRTSKPGTLSYEDLHPDIIEKTHLIINTTPLGMFPDIESKPELNYNYITSKHILFDLVYNPELTSFLKAGKERGALTISGISMLWSQAERSWEIWNDDKL
jgi:shikimate dehydrogenase